MPIGWLLPIGWLSHIGEALRSGALLLSGAVFGAAVVAGALAPQAGKAQDPTGGSSLTAVERSKLDGRFERVVRKAQGGTLRSAIREMEEVSSEIRKTSSEMRKQADQPGGQFEGKAQRPESRIQNGQLPEGEPERLRKSGRGALQALPMDVRPDARTPGGRPVYNAIVETQSPSALQAPGAAVVSAFNGFATVRATPRGLGALARAESVSKVRSPRVARPHNDVGAAEVGARTLNSGAVARTEYKGEGTLTCIIDTGIDWSHPDFTDRNGDTRIRAIWDQVDDSTSVSTPAENDPSRFRQNFNPDYGSEYLREDIQAALDGTGSVNQKDFDGHGTHVAGTAASSGQAYEQSSGTKRYRGAAPEADIIAVKAGNRTFSSVNYLNGIAYCQDVAESAGKPVVVNMSLGGDFGPHDGSALPARGIEQLSRRPGSVIVTSAGNSGSPRAPIHTQKSLAAGDSVDVGINVTQYTPNDGRGNDFYATTLWTYQPGPYEVSVYTPGQQDTVTVAVDGSQEVRDTTVATPRGAVFIQSSTEGNGRYFVVQSVDAAASQPPAEGEWTVRIRQNGSSATPVHGWFFGSVLGSGEEAGSAAFAQANNRFTISIPATSKGAIAVGNYIRRARWTTSQGQSRGFSGLPRGVINSSSSRGPTVDGRTKPDVSAPGTLTPSALSDDASAPPAVTVGDGEHQLLSGTSMSAPLTAGSVALLMEEDPSLSTDQVRSLLKNTARTDPFVSGRGGVPNQTFGAGKLNVHRALTSLLGEDAPLEVLFYNQPVSFGDLEPVTVGGDGVRRAALRFTPTQSGRIAGTYLSLGPNQQGNPANELSDSLRVEVWSDDGSGAPGSRIGESVAIAPTALRAFSPTFVNLSATGVAVRAGEDYHIVIEPEESGGSVELLAETAGPTAGRSATFDGDSWSGTGSDLVIRTQVRTDVTAPPPAADLGVETANPQDVSLSWEGAEAPDLGQYFIYRDTRPIGQPADLTPFDTTGAQANSYTDTTATEGRTYYYRVASVDRTGNESPLSSSASAFLYPDQVRAEFSRSFGDGGANSSDYRLLALPGTVDRDVGTLLSGQPGIDWSVLWDDGSDSNFLLEYDGSETFGLRPGRGFWVVSKQDLSVADTISTVDLQADTAATVSLHEGWNIISNPLEKAVPWSAISAASGGGLQPPHGFDGAFAQRDTLPSAKSGEALYFLNDQGLSELTIPYPGAPQPTGAGAEALATKNPDKNPESPAVLLTATPAGEREVSSTIQVRQLSGDDGDEKSSDEIVAPPTKFESVSLRIQDQSAERPRRGLLSVTERRLSQEQAIPLVLRSDTSVVRVRASVGDLAGKSVALIDQDGGRTYDLVGGEETTVSADEDGASRFDLVIGSDAYVEKQAQAAAPESVTLETAPNPLRERATIRYALPEKMPVRLEVYDVLGRRVATLVDGRKRSGTHRVQFSATGLSSGMYFGRLKAGEMVVTRKLTVVR